MSLLDQARDTITLYPETDLTDDLGNPTRGPDLEAGVECVGRVQPVSSLETISDGQNVSTSYRFITREFPAGAFARALWDGRYWDIEGEPARRNGSDTTKHATILMRARTPEATHG